MALLQVHVGTDIHRNVNFLPVGALKHCPRAHPNAAPGRAVVRVCWVPLRAEPQRSKRVAVLGGEVRSEQGER